MLHFISKHLEETKAYVRILFIDFSSAFNNVQPHLLLQKLKDMNVYTTLIKWFYSFLTDRIQQVKVKQTLSDIRHCNTGVPQVCVLSPILFTLYTNDCRKGHPNNFIFKFADDNCEQMSAIVSLLHK